MTTNEAATQTIILNQGTLNDDLEIKYIALFDDDGEPLALPQPAADSLLTGYTTTTGVHALAAGDTVLAALAKIESRLAILEA